MVNDGVFTDPPWYLPLLLAISRSVCTPFEFLLHETEVADGFPLMKHVIVTLFVPRMAEYDGCGMVTVKKSKTYRLKFVIRMIVLSIKETLIHCHQEIQKNKKIY